LLSLQSRVMHSCDARVPSGLSAMTRTSGPLLPHPTPPLHAKAVLSCVRLEQVRVGERVEAADARGERISSRVYFIHDHAEQAPIVEVKHMHGALPTRMEGGAIQSRHAQLPASLDWRLQAR
jgi:hypothetical protein